MTHQKSWKSSLSGFISGWVHLLFYPLELARLHMIVSDGHSLNSIPKYKHSLEVLKTLYSKQGLSSWYRGFYFTLNNSFTWAVYFFIYQKCKKWTPVQESQLKKFLVAAQTSIFTKILVNPISVVKTRVMLIKKPNGILSDFIQSVRKIYKIDGWKGYYSGILPGIFLTFHGAFQLYFYQSLKEKFESQNSKLKTLACGGASKAFSSFIFHPVMTIRFRLLQEQNRHYLFLKSKQIKKVQVIENFYQGISDCVRKTWRKQGVKGFYRGLGVSLFRLIPEYALFFLIYENMLRKLS